MYSPVLDVLEGTDVFSEGATFYPGDSLTITFENGTNQIDYNWRATYMVPYFTGPLTTGDEFHAAL